MRLNRLFVLYIIPYRVIVYIFWYVCHRDCVRVLSEGCRDFIIWVPEERHCGVPLPCQHATWWQVPCPPQMDLQQNPGFRVTRLLVLIIAFFWFKDTGAPCGFLTSPKTSFTIFDFIANIHGCSPSVRVTASWLEDLLVMISGPCLLPPAALSLTNKMHPLS